MKAIKVLQAGKPAIQDVDIPQLRPGFCLVRIKAVALNPTDYKHLHDLECTGCTLGCDYAGIIEAVGPNSPLKVGSRVAGVIHGGNTTHPEDGAFGQFSLVREGLQFVVPETMSFEEAASFGVAISTGGLSLCQALGLPLPTKPAEERTAVLIYGGSTATGTVAIQLAKMSGLEVITTCSPSSVDLVKSRGASLVFDYHDPGCGEKIYKHTNGKLYRALDCISEEASAAICSQALSRDTESHSVKYCSLLPIASPRQDVTSEFVLGYTAVGEAFSKWADFPARPQDYEFAKDFFRICQPLLHEGKIQPHPIELRRGGLQSIPEGLEDMRAGRVRAKKLVYRIG